MELMVMSGVVSLFFGVVFLFFPKHFQRWSNVANRRLNQLDPAILNHRIGAGIALLAVGAFCLASAFYVWLQLRS